MKKSNLIKAILVSSILLSSSAFAGTATSNLAVGATVAANCSISTSALSFGTYDPIVANASSALNGTGAVSVTCTNGSSTNIALGQGANAGSGSSDASPARRMKDGGTDYLSYSLYSDAARTVAWGNTTQTGVAGTGTGTAQTVNVYGQVPAGQNVPAGNYSDTVVATVTF